MNEVAYQPRHFIFLIVLADFFTLSLELCANYEGRLGTEENSAPLKFEINGDKNHLPVHIAQILEPESAFY